MTSEELRDIVPPDAERLADADARVRELEEAVRVLGNLVQDYKWYEDQSNDGFTDDEWSAFVSKKRGHLIEVNANPIARAALTSEGAAQ